MHHKNEFSTEKLIELMEELRNDFADEIRLRNCSFNFMTDDECMGPTADVELSKIAEKFLANFGIIYTCAYSEETESEVRERVIKNAAPDVEETAKQLYIDLCNFERDYGNYLKMKGMSIGYYLDWLEDYFSFNKIQKPKGRSLNRTRYNPIM